MKDNEKIRINNESLINKINEHISERRKESDLFSYDVDFDTNIIKITFMGTEEEKEEHKEYIKIIKGKPKFKKKLIENEKDGIYTLELILQFPELEEVETFLKVRNIKDKSLEENMLDWSEGSEELYKLLLLFKEYGIETFACCSGHGDINLKYVGIYIDPSREDQIKKVFSKMIRESFIIGVNYYDTRKRAVIYMKSSLELAELFRKAKNNTLDIDKESIEFKLTDYMFEKINEFNTNEANVGFNMFEGKIGVGYTHFEKNRDDIEEKDKKMLDRIKEVFNSKDGEGFFREPRKNHHAFGYTYKYKDLEDLYSKLKENFE